MGSTHRTGVERILVILGATLVAATVAVLVLTGGGGDGGSAARSAGAPTKADRVTIKSFDFTPPKIVVPVGTKITWTNKDSANHTATSGASASPTGVFDTGEIKGGASASVTVRKRGSFPYFCEFHPTMKGTVTVE